MQQEGANNKDVGSDQSRLKRRKICAKVAVSTPPQATIGLTERTWSLARSLVRKVGDFVMPVSEASPATSSITSSDDGNGRECMAEEMLDGTFEHDQETTDKVAGSRCSMASSDSDSEQSQSQAQAIPPTTTNKDGNDNCGQCDGCTKRVDCGHCHLCRSKGRCAFRVCDRHSTATKEYLHGVQASYLVKEDQIFVGTRVYCKYPQNDVSTVPPRSVFYWGCLLICSS
jgi:hypothetical protein